MFGIFFYKIKHVIAIYFIRFILDLYSFLYALYFQEPFFVARVVYDMLFFFIIIIIVLNLIFGVIIDTFADLRSEKQNKEEILKNTCFICGKLYNRYEKWDYLLYLVAGKKDYIGQNNPTFCFIVGFCLFKTYLLTSITLSNLHGTLPDMDRKLYFDHKFVIKQNFKKLFFISPGLKVT